MAWTANVKENFMFLDSWTFLSLLILGCLHHIMRTCNTESDTVETLDYPDICEYLAEYQLPVLSSKLLRKNGSFT